MRNGHLTKKTGSYPNATPVSAPKQTSRFMEKLRIRKEIYGMFRHLTGFAIGTTGPQIGFSSKN